MRRLGRVINTVGPDVALLKSAGRSANEIVIGGTMSSVPMLHHVDSLSLALRTIPVRTNHALTLNGVTVDVSATCQVKISGWQTQTETNVPHSSTTAARTGGDPALREDRAAIWLAAQHFLGKSESQISDAVAKTIAGYQRAIVAKLTVEQLYRDRELFCRQVLEICGDDMRNMGLSLVSYVVIDVSDTNGYIESLGVARTEAVKREAAEGLAVHQAQARVRAATAEASAHVQENLQQEVRIGSDMKRNARQTGADQVVSIMEVKKDKAREIATVEQEGILWMKRQRARAAEAKAELEVLEQEVRREQLRMEKEVNVEADALLYKATVDADAVIKAAQAEAEQIRLMANAEAASARAKGMAEVDLLAERNLTWMDTGSHAALLEKMAEAMPKVAAAIAEPLRDVEKVFLSTSR